MHGLWEAVGSPSPPYWAFAWLGGQALARYVLDTDLVRGRSVLDLATGSGLVALAALKAGASRVLAADVDPRAETVVRANAEANNLHVTFTARDLLEGPVPDVDVLLAGDVFYEQGMAARVLAWIGSFQGVVLLGDPGRDYLPREALRELAAYDIPTTRELEGVVLKRTCVYEVKRI